MELSKFTHQIRQQNNAFYQYSGHETDCFLCVPLLSTPLRSGGYDSLFGLVFVAYYISLLLHSYNSLDGFVWHSYEKNMTWYRWMWFSSSDWPQQQDTRRAVRWLACVITGELRGRYFKARNPEVARGVGGELPRLSSVPPPMCCRARKKMNVEVFTWGEALLMTASAVLRHVCGFYCINELK